MKQIVKGVFAAVILLAFTACADSPKDIHQKIENGEELTAEDCETMKKYCAEAVDFVTNGGSLSEANEKYPYATEFTVEIIKMKGSDAVNSLKELGNEAADKLRELGEDE